MVKLISKLASRFQSFIPSFRIFAEPVTKKVRRSYSKIIQVHFIFCYFTEPSSGKENVLDNFRGTLTKNNRVWGWYWVWYECVNLLQSLRVPKAHGSAEKSIKVLHFIIWVLKFFKIHFNKTDSELDQ